MVIDDPCQLPAIGAEETTELDFKLTYRKGDGFDAFEMAKDVAAMANANGGTILIGAAEDKNGERLGCYKPLDASTAKETATALEHAVGNRCSPRPVVSVSRIGVDGGEVVAVNVWAYPSQPVGVKVRGDKTDGWGEPAWVFPLRVATQTVPLLPEALPMMMEPDIRRRVILLSRIVENCSVLVSSGPTPSGYGGGGRAIDMVFLYQRVDVMQNIAVFKVRYNGGGKPTFNIIHIPLDDVRTVYEDVDGCRMSVAGYFLATDKAVLYRQA